MFYFKITINKILSRQNYPNDKIPITLYLYKNKPETFLCVNKTGITRIHKNTNLNDQNSNKTKKSCLHECHTMVKREIYNLQTTEPHQLVYRRGELVHSL